MQRTEVVLKRTLHAAAMGLLAASFSAAVMAQEKAKPAPAPAKPAAAWTT